MRRFFRALLGFGSAGVIIGTSLSVDAQPSQNARDDGKNIPIVASAPDKAAKDIYNITGEDLSNGAKTDLPGLIPTDDPKQKWCDDYDLKDGMIKFIGVKMKKNGVDGTADIPVKIMNPEAMKTYLDVGADFYKATEKNVKFFNLRNGTDKNTKLAYIVMEVPVYSETQWTDKGFITLVEIIELKLDQRDVKTTGDIFEGKVFDKSIFIGKNNEMLAATESCVEIIEPNTWKKTTLPLSKLIGTTPDQVPPMTDPRIYEENGWYVITDPIMMDNGTQMKVLFKIYSQDDKFESAVFPSNKSPPAPLYNPSE